MGNRRGAPIWYELLTNDPAASKAFYGDVIGWNIATASGAPGLDYRMILTSNGSFVGGMMPLNEEMRSRGPRPIWLFYLAVDNVDESHSVIGSKFCFVRPFATSSKTTTRLQAF